MHRPFPPSLTSLAASIFMAGLLVGGLAGCGSIIVPLVQSPPPDSYAGVTFGGKAMAGKQPLIGASVQLYAAGTSGNGSTATALLTSCAHDGREWGLHRSCGLRLPRRRHRSFTLLPVAANQGPRRLLRIARYSDDGAGTLRSGVASSQIVVNEVTTIAAVYALSQFLSAGANWRQCHECDRFGERGCDGVRAGRHTQGTSPGPSFAANGSSPAPKIDSIANALNGCVASTANGSACTALFSATAPVGGQAPTNTLDAALNLTRNPGVQRRQPVHAIDRQFRLFSPVLAAVLSDWTLFVNYTGGGMNSPSGLGIDSAGNVWVASYFNVASLFSPLGKPLLASGVTGFGLSASYGLAVDANDDAWIPNEPNPGFRGTASACSTPADNPLPAAEVLPPGGSTTPLRLPSTRMEASGSWTMGTRI